MGYALNSHPAQSLNSFPSQGLDGVGLVSPMPAIDLHSNNPAYSVDLNAIFDPTIPVDTTFNVPVGPLNPAPNVKAATSITPEILIGAVALLWLITRK